MPAAWRRTTRASAGGSALAPIAALDGWMGARVLTPCHVSRQQTRTPRPPRMRAAAVVSVARRVAASGAPRLASSGTPTYTGSVYKESEKARESAYFSKKDEMALRALLGKVKSSADAACANAAQHSAKEEQALSAIVGKYKLDAKDVQGARGGRGARTRAVCVADGAQGLRRARALRRLTRNPPAAAQR